MSKLCGKSGLNWENTESSWEQDLNIFKSFKNNTIYCPN